MGNVVVVVLIEPLVFPEVPELPEFVLFPELPVGGAWMPWGFPWAVAVSAGKYPQPEIEAIRARVIAA